jgi:serine/threonine protein kinase
LVIIVFLKLDEIISQIGKGGCAIVYKVKNIMSGELFAAKYLIETLSKHEAEDEIFQILGIECPYLVKFIECLDINGSKIIIMELCTEGDLNIKIELCKKEEMFFKEKV